MKVHQPCCPECGSPAIGTLERLSGVAMFGEGVAAPDLDVEYSGWAEIWWDEQSTVHQNEDAPESPVNLPLVCCAQGHNWPSSIDW
jgi:hypothetical protein